MNENKNIIELIDSLIWLVNDTCNNYRKNTNDSAKKADECLQHFFSERVCPLKIQISKLAKAAYTLAFIGLTNVGKSTLAEALLEAPVAPSISGPGTSFPIEYRYNDTWRLEIRGINSDKKTFPDAISLGCFLQEKCLGLNTKEASNIFKACVYGPMPLLQNGLILADTPGFGAASADGNDAKTVSERLKNYVEKNLDEIYFCISSSNGQVKKEEKDFFDKLRKKCCAVVITKWGEDDEDDEKEYISRYEHIFHPCKMLFVGVRRNFGINQLKQLIQANSSIINRQKKYHDQIKDLWYDMNTAFDDLLGEKCKWDNTRLEIFLGCLGVKNPQN